MKMLISRFIAILILVIPGFMAMMGFLMMKDAVFLYISVHGDDSVANPAFGWLSFLGGLALFVIGIGFLGGWILFRDRKRNYVGPRFKKKRQAPKSGTSSKN
ncbi:DUF2627 domain-containing protein [Paenibacillus sp. ISL-20]|uniref:DUF2627 domain-containing protein n=1 Tax=Paenibacillus sp. ISL-20 TaxID=2819163 RepID=UPI001BE70FBA|nr:DUF2627 domain-containing protein [Paenibacillus sp. ISL-20]MBT2760807.1 DUF2627 domain-containing protein [Paenibacillus sp. ISL-20]